MTPIKVNVHRCYCCSIYFTVTVGFSIKCNSDPIMSVTRPLASCWGIILVFPCVNCQVIADERERDVYLSNRLINWICIFTSVFTLPEHLSTIVRFLCIVLYAIVCRFVPFPLANILSVLRFTASDYPFGVFKLSILYLIICKIEINNV